MKKITLYLALLFVVFTLFACEEDVKNEEGNAGPDIEKLLPGDWSLVSATRNGKETELLAGTYFSFSPEGQMVTNFGIGNGQDRTAYVIERENDRKVIRPQDDKKQHFTYEVVLINDTTLVLKTSVRDMSFEMTLKREEKENEPKQEQQGIIQ